MFANIWLYLKMKFAVKIGKLLKIIFKNAVSVFAKEILDEENQRVAYEFVRALNEKKDLTNKQKAEAFNCQMIQWGIKFGKELKESTINCLRELAVNAIKSEILNKLKN